MNPDLESAVLSAQHQLAGIVRELRAGRRPLTAIASVITTLTTALLEAALPPTKGSRR